MIEWLKTKAILILGIILAISIAGNVVFSFVVFKNGLKITKNDYITTISKSYSSSSSGAMNMNVLGQQQYWNGKYKTAVKTFESRDEMVKFMDTMNLPEWVLSKPIHIPGQSVYELYWPKFVEEKDKSETPVKKTYKEVLDK